MNFYITLLIITTLQVEENESSGEPISHELTNPPEVIHEEVVETTEIKDTAQLENPVLEPIEDQALESSRSSTSSRSSPTPSTKSSTSNSSPVSSSEEIKGDEIQSDEE